MGENNYQKFNLKTIYQRKFEALKEITKNLCEYGKLTDPITLDRLLELLYKTGSVLIKF